MNPRRSARYARLVMLITLLISGLGVQGGAPTPTAAASSGAALVWGGNLFGQLGDGTNTDRALPVAISQLTTVVALAKGKFHSLVVLSDGTVRAWGANNRGQLGNGTTGGASNVPVTVSGLTKVVAVSTALNHSLALLSDGTVKAWGANNGFQLGDGTFTDRNTPVSVGELTNVVAIASGNEFSVALLGDGTVKAWGLGVFGQMGNGEENGQDRPVTACASGSGDGCPPLTNVVAIAAGSQHVVALLRDGTVRTWGANYSGQLGHWTAIQSSLPKPVCAVGGPSGCDSVLINVAAISTGGAHNLALLRDGTVRSWGDNLDGELGIGTFGAAGCGCQVNAVAVSGLTNVAAIAAGDFHSLALLRDGTVRAWGSNGGGQLGDGTGMDSSVPVTVCASGGGVGCPALSGIVAIAAGSDYNLAIKSATSPACGQAFGDVAATNAACEAIEGLATRGVIKGCDPTATPPSFCPTDNTFRHQMAAFIVRAIPAWASETGLPTFGDNTSDTELMTRVATLQRHGVVRGYQTDVCQKRNIATPPGCYGPLDTVKYGQVMLFIARAMEKAGYWTLQPDDRSVFPDQNGAVGADPATDQQTLDHRYVVTYVHYVGNPPDVADVHANFALTNGQGWADASSRAWFARAFWPAIKDH